MANCRGGNNYEELYEESRPLQKDKATLRTDRDLCNYVMDEYTRAIAQLRIELEEYEEEIYNLDATVEECEYEIQQNERNFQHRLQQEQQQNLREVQILEYSYDDILASKQAKINGQERELKRLNFSLKEQKDRLEDVKSMYRDNLNHCQQERQKMFKLQSQLNESQQLLKYSKKEVEHREVKIRILEQKVDDMNIKTDNNHRYRIYLNKWTDQSFGERDQLRQTLRGKENELSKIKFERDREICRRQEIERKLETKERTIRILEDENSQNISSHKYKILQIERELRDLKFRSKDCFPSVKYHQEDKHINKQMLTTLKQKICHLELELEKRDQYLKDLKEILDSRKLESVKEREFIMEVQKTEGDSSELKYQLRKAESKLKDTRTKLHEAKFESDSERQTRQTLERKTKEYEIRIKELEQKYENLERLQKQRIQDLQTEVECRDIKLKQIQEIQDKSNVKASKKTEVTTNLKKQNEQLAEQRDMLQQASTKLKESEAKLNEAVSERDLERTSKHELERKMKAYHARIKELEQINDKQVTQQNDRIQTLQRDVDSRDLKLKDLEEILDNRNGGLMKEKVVTTDLEKRDAHLSETRHQLHIAQTRLKESEAKLSRAITERDLERTAREKGEMKMREHHSTVKKLQQEHDILITPLNQKIQYLEREVERRDSKLKDLEDTLDSRNVEADTVTELMKDLKSNEDLLSEQRKQLQRALTKLNETTSERNKERQTRTYLERDANENHTRFKALEQRNNAELTTQNQRIQHLERELRDLKIKDLEEMSGKTKAEVNKGNELGNALRKKEKRLEQLEEHLNQTTAKLKATEAELEETKTRLSKAMGDKLTDNNPNIADLSDKNRPVKLAERYAELYDNHWTDAFDILGNYFQREQQTIEALLVILQDVMRFCVESGSQQMKNLQSALGFSNVPNGDMPADVRKNLKDGRKAASPIALRNLYEVYLSHLKRASSQTLGRALEVRQYVQESLEICWLMVIQDPPVVFAPVAKQGSELNTDVFKPYTSSGTHVEYTVWPALLLHEGGPVLAKGVAQGYGKKAK